VVRAEDQVVLLEGLRGHPKSHRKTALLLDLFLVESSELLNSLLSLASLPGQYQFRDVPLIRVKEPVPPLVDCRPQSATGL
jgi:hypothetical protein